MRYINDSIHSLSDSHSRLLGPAFTARMDVMQTLARAGQIPGTSVSQEIQKVDPVACLVLAFEIEELDAELIPANATERDMSHQQVKVLSKTSESSVHAFNQSQSTY